MTTRAIILFSTVASAAAYAFTHVESAACYASRGSVELQGTGIATPSSRRRVDGVEVDAAERDVKF